MYTFIKEAIYWKVLKIFFIYQLTSNLNVNWKIYLSQKSNKQNFSVPINKSSIQFNKKISK